MSAESSRRRVPTAVVVLASVIPGLGHLLAGRSRTGLALLAGTASVVAGGAYAYRTVAVETLIVRPDVLVGVAVALLVVGVLWCAVVVSAYRAVAPAGTTWIRRLPVQVLALGLCVGVLTPATASAQQVHAAAQALDVFATEPTAKDRKPFAGKKRVNLLLLGGDAGSNRRGTRADVIMVASMDTVTGRTTLISLPRNLQNVPLRPGTRLAKAYPRGFKDFWFGLYTAVERNPKLWPGVPRKQAPAAAMADTVGYLTKLKIHHYAVVNMKGFEHLVNALGGVTVVVRSGNGRPIPIGGSHDSSGRVQRRPHGQIKLGKQHLGGYKSMWYVRSRFDAGDSERQARQRCFLTALARQAEPASVAKTVQRYTAASRQIMITNVTKTDLADFVTLARKKARTAKIERVTILDVVGSSIHPNTKAIRHRVKTAVAGKAKPTAYKDYGVKRKIC
ncbi:MAG: LCP family protein [Sporichthyaceae bacterium]